MKRPLQSPVPGPRSGVLLMCCDSCWKPATELEARWLKGPTWLTLGKRGLTWDV